VKEEGAIKHKLKQVRFRHLKKRVEAALKPTPEACLHNRALVHPLSDDTPVGVCIHPDQEAGENLCDAAWEGCAKAKQCPLFTPRVSKEEAKVQFKDSLAEMDFAEIAFLYPDMAALMWVLGQEEAGNDWEGSAELPTPVWADLYGIKLLAETSEAQGALDKLLEQIAEDHALREMAKVMQTRLNDSLAKNTLLREKLGALQEEVAALKAPEPLAQPLPWWKRVGGWFG
jgi:hypothetical protein